MKFINTGALIKKKLRDKKRQDKHFTGVWMGKQLNVTSQFISNWQRSISAPPLNKVKTVCLLLNIGKTEYEEAWLADHRKELKEALK